MSLTTQVANLATRIGTEFKSVRASIGSLGSLTTTDKTSIVNAINEVKSTAGATINDVTASTTSVYSSSEVNTLLGAKLNSSAYTAADVLAKIETVAGSGSGLDADMLDGNHATAFATAGHLHTGVYQPLSGDLTAIAGLAGTSGALKKTAANTWTLDTTTYATPSDVSSAINAVVGAAPAALDTLVELATALGNDANFSGTITTALSNRVRVDAAQTFTSVQQAQGIANLGAISASDVGSVTTDFVAAFNAALI